MLLNMFKTRQRLRQRKSRQHPQIIKICKSWNLYHAVVEPIGTLRDEVRVRRKVEAHPEGYYYIES